jgi:serine/threonine protein kinase/Tol biopolymer transport system component
MIGKSLAHYEITSKLGQGGMGEVYQAKDRKLGRDVAIKVLPDEFAKDTDRVARFQREAKLLASLNHPNIAAIYGLEESGRTNFLVLELVEGQTLADRIKAAPIPIEESLKLALQIAEALEAAHEKGVIHRDLKPANIKVTPEGKVKVLDFGLAKAFAGDKEEVNLSNSPTLSDAATQQGVILGTAAYMSPEQARGKSVDKRADIWAFGCVLFEMLTGHAAFSGKDVTDILAAVIRTEPEWNGLPANLHWRLREVLERCLKKEAKDRYREIFDAKVDIQKVLTDPRGVFAQPAAGVKPRSKIKTVLPWIAAAVGIIVVGALIWRFKPTEPRRVMRFIYELPEGQQFNRSQQGEIYLAVSPDGSQFVYGTTEGLYLRSVDALDARLIPGTDRTSVRPIFSPDGQWIGYWSAGERKLKKIAVSGGAPVVLCDTGLAVVGESWHSDNTIVYSDLMGGGLKRVSGDGGTPESIVKVDLLNAKNNGLPIFPQILPDGKTLLSSALFDISDLSNMQVVLYSLKSGERKALFRGGGATYLSTGHIVYGIANNNAMDITAVPFDLDRLEVKGGPVPLVQGVMGSAISDSGTLVYVPQTAGTAPLTAAATAAQGRTLVWVDRKGREELIKAPPYRYQFPKISGDGKRVAFTVNTGGNTDIWIWDLVRESLTRLTFDKGQDLTPIWSRDGQRIAFCSLRQTSMLKGGLGGVFWRASDGTGDDEFLGAITNRILFPYSWSGDGKNLVFVETDASTKIFDIGVLSMEGDHPSRLLLKEDYIETQPQISPDGRWMAYCSTETGKNEVYVRPFPEVNKGKWQVSTDGGDSPLWSPDGRELFCMIGNGDGVMSVALEAGQSFKAGKPSLLFRGKYVGPLPGNGLPWDISPDGKRFLMMKEIPAAEDKTKAGAPAAPAPQPKITIVVNWFEELKQRVPVK